MTDSVDPEELGEPNQETQRAVNEHMARHGFKATGSVLQPAHEQRFVYTMVHLCAPTEQRPMVTMYTTGMSDREMVVDAGSDGRRHAELVMFLPPDWPIDGAGGVSDDARLAWSVQWLEGLTRYPHLSKRGVGPGHLIPTGQDEPLAGTKFTAFVLLEPTTLPFAIPTQDGREIKLLTLFPLYPEEVTLKRKAGMSALLTRLREAGIGDLAEPARRNVGAVTSKPFWKFW